MPDLLTAGDGQGGSRPAEGAYPGKVGIRLSPDPPPDGRPRPARKPSSGVLQAPDDPPRPACPECGASPERIDSMVGDFRFGVSEPAVLVNFKPCGHRFRSVVA